MKLQINGAGKPKHILPAGNESRRDYQVSRIYRAETSAEDNSPFVIKCFPPEYINAVIEKFLEPLSKSRLIGSAFHGKTVAIKVSQSSHRRSRAQDGKAELCVRKWGITGYEVLHEIAHALQGSSRPHHGIVFTSIYLMLVRVAMPLDCYDELAEQFDKESIRYCKVSEKGVMYGKRIGSEGKRTERSEDVRQAKKPARRSGWLY